MCGLTGIVNLDGSPIDIAVLSAMTSVQHHRGPDDSGRLAFSLRNGTQRAITIEEQRGTVPFEGGLGFNRLSILDPSERGHQPMVSDDGQVVIAYNGEIFNAFDLRPDLEAKGHRFRSNTDTEVLLNLYRAYGQEEMLARVNGMFAVCIVDLGAQRVTLSRDRLGIKPLYVCRLPHQFLFASEVKSFLRHPAFAASLATDGELDEYLTFRYCAADRHLLAGVEQVEPGCWIELALGGHRGTPRRYWSIPDTPHDHALTSSAAADEVEHWLERSVQRQLLSDVKLGCQLSGGIDSSLVNVFAARHAGDNLDAFSVLLDDPDLTEARWIETAAAKAHVVSHTATLTPSYFAEGLEKATWHLDQPLNHPNSLGLMLLAENASPHVKVLLSGEGADELLGGYPRYLHAAHPWLRPAARRGDRVQRFVMASAFVDGDRARRLLPSFNGAAVLERRRAIFAEGNSADHVANCLRYDLRTYLVDLLVRQDKMTMAHSIENRVPFLDHELVERARRQLGVKQLVRPRTSWPPRQLVPHSTKIVLKDVARRHFDAPFVYRHKAGFALPLRAFFTAPGFRSKIDDQVMPGMRARGVLDAAHVEALWRNAGTATTTDLEALWVAIALEVWLQQVCPS
jgi:asparagine synthase (glutamine-hydrolysing)